MQKCTNSFMYQYNNAPIHYCTNAILSAMKIPCSDIILWVLIVCFNGMDLDFYIILMHQYINATMHECTNTQMHQCINTLMNQYILCTT